MIRFLKKEAPCSDKLSPDHHRRVSAIALQQYGPTTRATTHSSEGDLVSWRIRFAPVNLRLGLLTLASVQKIVAMIFKTGKTTSAKEKQEFLFQNNLFPRSRAHWRTLAPMNCPVCNQETETSRADYCFAHRRGLENVRQAFEKWTVAYGNLTLPDFLQRAQKAPGIGPRAKEVARFLSENPSRLKR
jgi:hypothetical protein